MLSVFAILAAIPVTTAAPRDPPCRVVYAPLAYRAVLARCRPTLPRQFVDRP